MAIFAACCDRADLRQAVRHSGKQARELRVQALKQLPEILLLGSAINSSVMAINQSVQPVMRAPIIFG